MAESLSMDLRSRLFAAVEDCMSCRVAAARFGVAPSTAIRWQVQPAALLQSLKVVTRSRRVEEHRYDILALWAARKDITREESRAALAEIGLTVSEAGLHRFFVRRGIRAAMAAAPEARACAWLPAPPQNDHADGPSAYDRHGCTDGARGQLMATGSRPMSPTSSCPSCGPVTS